MFRLSRRVFIFLKVVHVHPPPDEGTLRMFSDLGMVTVVEGIETKEQYDMVVSMGTLWMQGYLFSPPLPEKEYLAYIDRESKDAE